MNTPIAGAGLATASRPAASLEHDRADRPAGVVVLVPADRTRAWSCVLRDALERRLGLPAELRWVPGLASAGPIPSEMLERRVLRAARRGHSAWRPTSSGRSCEDVGDWPRRLVVNATGREPSALPASIREATIVSPTFQGGYGLETLARTLARGEPAHVGVAAVRAARRRILYGAWLAASEPPLLHRALDLVLARAITLVVAAADNLINERPSPEPEPPPSPSPSPGALGVWTQRIVRTEPARVGRQLRKPFVRDGWQIGLRPLTGEVSPLELNLDPATFRIIESPPDRFYADPFLLRHEGKTALFFEDYDYDLRRACISHTVLDEDGEPGPAAPALTRPYHLSYPFVFTHDGAALMVPETSANRTIELYEACAFPGEWRLRTVLIDDIDASDTTLHFDGATGLWWMFSAVSEFGGSSHDSLSIFFSPRLEGPWWPHRGNPVKLDPGSSRPAGPLLAWNGRLLRPTQDCTLTYGGGVAWCEIRRLEPTAFREERVGRAPVGRGARTPPHTYGRAAGLEVADFKVRRSRYRLPWLGRSRDVVAGTSHGRAS
jgi:hypothetical protein